MSAEETGKDQSIIVVNSICLYCEKKKKHTIWKYSEVKEEKEPE